MDFCSLSSPRIVEERKRLGLNQAEAGESCGVSREMWGKYERSKAAVSSEVLFQFAQIGADVQYILTGIRSSVALAPDERFMIERYRNSSQELKDATIRLLAGEANVVRKADFVVHGNVGQQVKVEGDFSQSGFTIFGGSNKKKK